MLLLHMVRIYLCFSSGIFCADCTIVFMHSCSFRIFVFVSGQARDRNRRRCESVMVLRLGFGLVGYLSAASFRLLSFCMVELAPGVSPWSRKLTRVEPVSAVSGTPCNSHGNSILYLMQL